MNIFTILNDVLNKKRGNLLSGPEQEAEFQPYLVQRWISMRDPQLNNILNETTNKLYSAFTEKQEWYKMFLCLIPRMKFKRINYIKKNKEKRKKDENLEKAIKIISASYNISQREVRSYIEEYNLDVDKFIKCVK